MRLTFLISDHGWGHLGRSLVVARAILGRGHALQMVVSEAMASRVAETLPDADVTTGALDQGYVFGAGGRGADAAATRPRLAACARGPAPELVEAARAWAPDVVLADATSWASTVATAVGVPSVLTSNFGWDVQFAALYDGDPEAVDDVRAVVDQVCAFDLALELPLGPGAPAVRERRRVALVGQRPSGVAPFEFDRPVVAWAFGRTPPDAQPLDGLRALAQVAAERGLALVLNESLRPEMPDLPGAHFLPDETPWPDVLAASRLVVSKAGYSTLAEALRGPGHVIATGVTGLPEERAMQSELEARGLGRGIPVASDDESAATVAEAIEAAARNLLDRPERTPNDESGEVEIVEALEAFIEA